MMRRIILGLTVAALLTAGIWQVLGAVAWSGISGATALAAVALLGYLVGRSQLRYEAHEAEVQVAKTQEMIDQLDTISKQIRKSLATQHASIRVFREKVRALCETEDDATRAKLVEQAERILQPTAELSSEIATTYETIRRETGALKRIRTSGEASSSRA